MKHTWRVSSAPEGNLFLTLSLATELASKSRQAAKVFSITITTKPENFALSAFL